MIKNLTKKVAQAVAPQFVFTGYHYVRLNRQVRRLNDALHEAGGPQQYCDVLWQFPDFQPFQKKSEIASLLEIVKLLQPQSICEIGAAGGGTACLFAQASVPEAMLISVDVAFNPLRKSAIERFAKEHQRIICLEGDSHSLEMLYTVTSHLEGQNLDFLFIDGDHSYDGVWADFKLYSPLVRRGGIIAFHDIVPDFKTRCGMVTNVDGGEVPRFWAEIKSIYASVEEIIEDPGQDGYGIGVLYWNGEKVQ